MLPEFCILRGTPGTTASESKKTYVRISRVAWSRSSLLWAWLRTRVRTGSSLSLKSANLMYISYTDVDVHEWSSAYLRICEVFRFTHISGLSWDRHQKYQRAAILTKCNTTHYSFAFAIVLPHPTFHLEYMYTYIYTTLGEEAQTKNSVLWIYSLPGGPADFRAFSHAMQTLA